ncbi:MAG TPA: hydroxymethylglutaryl-CoA lyase, partial [Fimbriimonadaceae bacterium]|nr:hydroxymethylglutaryl-CoA lyase [Fimbriimonadaceae bacterium]
GDAAEVWPKLPPGGTYSALVPNEKGLERAVEVGVKRIALFTAASDAFTLKNINRTVEDSLQEFEKVVESFRAAVSNGFVRGYVSTAFQCPYAGKIPVEKVLAVCRRLSQIGVDELSIGDTIGAASPVEVRELGKAIAVEFSVDKVAMHFHDTHGTAIANVAAALELGFATFDSSAAGLGGCPYAPGAAGNLATDDLVYFLERQGIPTGVDREKLAKASLPILQALGRPPQAKAQLAELASGGSPNRQ